MIASRADRAAMTTPRSAAGLGHDVSVVPPVTLGGEAALRCTLIPPRDSAKPVVVLLHGWVMNRSTWADAAAPLLAAGYGLLLPDLPGHGESPPMPWVRNKQIYDAMADRVAAAMDEASLQSAPVAGYSMGGTVALALARRRPDLVASLFLLDPIVRFPMLQMAFAPLRLHLRFVKNMLGAIFGPRGKHILRALIGLTGAGMYMPVFLKRLVVKAFDWQHAREQGTYVGCRDANDVEIFLDGFTRTSYAVAAATLEAKFRTSYVDVFSTFPGPIHLATGSEDCFVPPAFVRSLSRQGLRGPRGEAHPTAIVEGFDHTCVCIAPDVVGRLLAAWLDDTARSGPRALPAAALGAATPST